MTSSLLNLTLSDTARANVNETLREQFKRHASIIAALWPYIQAGALQAHDEFSKTRRRFDTALVKVSIAITEDEEQTKTFGKLGDVALFLVLDPWRIKVEALTEAMEDIVMGYGIEQHRLTEAYSEYANLLNGQPRVAQFIKLMQRGDAHYDKYFHRIVQANALLVELQRQQATALEHPHLLEFFEHPLVVQSEKPTPE